MSLVQELQSFFFQALCKSFPAYQEQFTRHQIEITPATQAKFGHFQCNTAMKLTKLIKANPKNIAITWVEMLKKLHLQHTPAVFDTLEIAGTGFINITLQADYLAHSIHHMLNSPRLNVPMLAQQNKCVMDFSSPNIAKEMHVGHLRSTIIGESLARLFEFLGYRVLRLNHVGDWGTQFGMLIAYLKQHHNESELDAILESLTPGDLVQQYKTAKQQFDANPEFKTQAQQEVVLLQQHHPESLRIWEKICAISRIAYNEIYDLLNVTLTERGESFYHDMLPKIITELEQKNLITVSNQAKCVFLPHILNRDNEPLPLIVQKSDNGYNYATTDLAALKHRIDVEKAEKIIYLTDAGQSLHFDMVFKTAKLASFYDPQKIDVIHAPFGLVLREDGKKFKTRSGDTVRLMDLLTEAIQRAHTLLTQRDKMDPNMDLNKTAKILGLNAIKYSELACHRYTDYRFSFDKMLKFEGNTAAFLLYAYVRVQSIKKKLEARNPSLPTELSQTMLVLKDDHEIALALHIVQYPEMLMKCAQELLPNRLTDYLYQLAEKFHSFFHRCRVEGTPEQNSRLLLCEAVARLMKHGLFLLGLEPLERM